MKKTNKTDVFLVLQTVVLFSLMYFLIMALLYKELFTVVNLITALFLFLIAIKNFVLKQDKIESLICIICGIIVLVVAII